MIRDGRGKKVHLSRREVAVQEFSALRECPERFPQSPLIPTISQIPKFPGSRIDQSKHRQLRSKETGNRLVTLSVMWREIFRHKGF